VIDERARIEEAKPIVLFLAKRIARGLKGAVDVDDLVSVGHAALHDAARTYDPARAKFTTYARRRVKWAMLDHVRRTTHGRSSNAQALVAAERFIDGHFEEPIVEGLDPDAYHKRLSALLGGQALALAVPIFASEPEPVVTPEERTASAQVSHHLWRAVEALEPKERAIIERHYRDGEPFDAVAKEIGISKSWASRVHAHALEKLAKSLKRSL
jgi:RNA polymerase sigma factor for flagellar operon FliA